MHYTYTYLQLGNKQRRSQESKKLENISDKKFPFPVPISSKQFWNFHAYTRI